MSFRIGVNSSHPIIPHPACRSLSSPTAAMIYIFSLHNRGNSSQFQRIKFPAKSLKLAVKWWIISSKAFMRCTERLNVFIVNASHPFIHSFTHFQPVIHTRAVHISFRVAASAKLFATWKGEENKFELWTSEIWIQQDFSILHIYGAPLPGDPLTRFRAVNICFPRPTSAIKTFGSSEHKRFLLKEFMISEPDIHIHDEEEDKDLFGRRYHRCPLCPGPARDLTSLCCTELFIMNLFCRCPSRDVSNVPKTTTKGKAKYNYHSCFCNQSWRRKKYGRGRGRTFPEINFKTAKAHKQTINFAGEWVKLSWDRYQDTVLINLRA